MADTIQPEDYCGHPTSDFDGQPMKCVHSAPCPRHAPTAKDQPSPPPQPIKPEDIKPGDRGRAMRGWCLLTVWPDGQIEYVRAGMKPTDPPSVFTAKKAAQEARDFLWIGLEGDAQSINVVRPPLADGRPAVVGVRGPRRRGAKRDAE